MQQQLRRERIYRSELEGIKRMLSSEKYLVESKLNQTVDLLASNKLELSRCSHFLSSYDESSYDHDALFALF